MIERVIGAFQNLGFDLTDTEIADILWLAVQMRSSQSSSVSKTQQENSASTQKIASASPLLPSEQNRNFSKSINKTEASANVYLQSSQDNDQTSSGIPIKVPAAQALRNQLEIARALRPLKRRAPSKREFVLDEAATAERIAKEKLLLPVMKPASERWLELALVVDEGASMMLWTQTIEELKQLLEGHGAFRDVRTWGLFTDEGGKVWLRPRTNSVSSRKRLHNPRELIDPNGRRLFVVISDCVSPAWRSGSIIKALAAWAHSSPTAIIQVLPQWLWERSALGVAESILLRSSSPGVPNQQLVMTALDLLDETNVCNKLKIPVVTLEPESLKNWARMVAGWGDVQIKGFLLATHLEIDANSELTENSGIELSANQRLQRFRLTASPVARKLAGLLAAVPISLPVVRLIQQTMLPQSTQVHVAEVFLGGILKPLSSVHDGVETDNVQFDFIDGVRDLLLDGVPLTESTEVLRKVSDYLAERSGLSVENFVAMLANPRLAVDSSNGVLVRPFAQITAKVLRRLGGQYTKLAEEIEEEISADISNKRQVTTVKQLIRSQAQQSLLSVVKEEVTARLKQSLQDSALINLSKELQPQQVKRPWDAEIKIGLKPALALPNTTTILEVFDSEEIAGKLLILGPPGSGKTTTQLELGQELIKRAEEQPDYPVPVLFNLSSWKDDSQSLTDWLVAELKSKYGVSNKLGKEWVDNQQLLPLLDSLHELEPQRQELCVHAINQFLASKTRPLYLVVCSPSKEYNNYSTQLLQLNGAIYLQPLMIGCYHKNNRVVVKDGTHRDQHGKVTKDITGIVDLQKRYEIKLDKGMTVELTGSSLELESLSLSQVNDEVVNLKNQVSQIASQLPEKIGTELPNHLGYLYDALVSMDQSRFNTEYSYITGELARAVQGKYATQQWRKTIEIGLEKLKHKMDLI